jgi:hypothetical protein
MDPAVSTDAGYEVVEINRPTREGGTLRLYDPPRIDKCCACGSNDGPIGVAVKTSLPGEPTLDIALCAGCLCEALAILLGRRHVQTGGDAADLATAPLPHDFRGEQDGHLYCLACGIVESSAAGKWATCSGRRGVPGGA